MYMSDNYQVSEEILLIYSIHSINIFSIKSAVCYTKLW